MSGKTLQTIQKIKELELENKNYKILIENMTKEMESVSNRLMFS